MINYYYTRSLASLPFASVNVHPRTGRPCLMLIPAFIWTRSLCFNLASMKQYSSGQSGGTIHASLCVMHAYMYLGVEVYGNGCIYVSVCS